MLTGRDLTPELLWRAYCQGWFPMTVDELTDEVEFFQSRRRCLFPIEGVRVSRSLARVLKRDGYEFRVNTSFEEVMRGCLRGQGDNWISDEFVRVYGEVFRQGWAHCGEVWVEAELVGGIYGVAVGTGFRRNPCFIVRLI